VSAGNNQLPSSDDFPVPSRFALRGELTPRHDAPAVIPSSEGVTLFRGANTPGPDDAMFPMPKMEAITASGGRVESQKDRRQSRR